MSFRWLFNALSPAGKAARLSVLIFHRVRATPDGLFPREPDAEQFEAKLRLIADWFHVMPLTEAIQAMRRGTLPARALAITFDDGYADNHTVALPILIRLKLPATFFVTSGYLDGGRMWNDTVIEAIRAAENAELDLSDLQLGHYPLTDTAARVAAISALVRHLKYLP